MIINASTGMGSGAIMMTITFSGSNINSVWQYIKEGYDPSDGWTINDTTHTVSTIETMPSTPVTLSSMADGLLINQNGTKLKQPATGDVPEMIFKKQ